MLTHSSRCDTRVERVELVFECSWSVSTVAYLQLAHADLHIAGHSSSCAIIPDVTTGQEVLDESGQFELMRGAMFHTSLRLTSFCCHEALQGASHIASDVEHVPDAARPRFHSAGLHVLDHLAQGCRSAPRQLQDGKQEDAACKRLGLTLSQSSESFRNRKAPAQAPPEEPTT